MLNQLQIPQHQPGRASAAGFWHAPDDFATWPAKEREDILRWGREVVVRGSTAYRAYQTAAMKIPFALRLPHALAAVDARSRDQANRRPDGSGSYDAMTADEGLDREVAT